MDNRPHAYLNTRRRLSEIGILGQCIISRLNSQHRLIADTKQMLPNIITGDYLTKAQRLRAVSGKTPGACRNFFSHLLRSKYHCLGPGETQIFCWQGGHIIKGYRCKLSNISNIELNILIFTQAGIRRRATDNLHRLLKARKAFIHLHKNQSPGV